MADELRLKCPTCDNYPLQSTIDRYGTCAYCYRHGTDNQYKADVEQRVFELEQKLNTVEAQLTKYKIEYAQHRWKIGDGFLATGKYWMVLEITPTGAMKCVDLNTGRVVEWGSYPASAETRNIHNAELLSLATRKAGRDFATEAKAKEVNGDLH